MAKTLVKLFAVLALVIIAILVVVALNNSAVAPKPESENNLTSQPDSNMKFSSTAFKHNEQFPQKYTCDGERELNPPLSLGEIPDNAVSLAIIFDDPDAPSGDWVHWIMWNLAPDVTEIVEGKVPEGVVEGTTSFGTTGYGGPCPPAGTHRYFFKLYALDIEIDLTQTADKQKLLTAMDGHILDQTELVGLYSRN